MMQKPMDLKNLPGYLKSVRENGNTDESPLVNMGQIINVDSETGFMRWSKKIALAASICMILAIGIMTHNSMSTKQYTVIVGMNQGADVYQTIPQIVSENGGEIISVKQRNDSTYEVKVATNKSRSSFLEWFRKNRDIQSVK
jgi:predicted alternative tryptophan synthase beta-subunit